MSLENFPKIAELPLVQSSEDWSWMRLEENWHGANFWVGEEKDGRKWLIKMTGPFRALRERAFAVIAQDLGLSCQSSTFLKLSPASEPLRRTPNAPLEQLAIWKFPEHAPHPCRGTCPIQELFNDINATNDKIRSLKKTSISCALDWAKGEMLGYLCNMHEPPGRLFTPAHQFVQIDNELMFTDGPADLLECAWLKAENNEWSKEGLEVAQELCEAVASLPDGIIASAATIPWGYSFEMLWNVPRQIWGIRERAKRFAREINRI